MTLRAIGRALWQYAVPAIVLGQLALVFGEVLVTDRAPVGQAPTPGYEAVENRTRVVWEPNGLTGKFKVQVILDGGDWSLPAVEEEHSGTHALLPRLDPGRTYHWRVVHLETGATSEPKTFQTSPNHVVY